MRILKSGLFLVLIAALYLLPLRGHFALREGEVHDRIRPAPEAGGLSGERPVYREGFVNPERPGIIRHVSSVSSAGEGRVACAWYEGTREGAKDVSIRVAIYDERGGRWSGPRVLVDRATASRELRRYVKKVGNSLVYRDERGRLWLFYVSIVTGGWSCSSINYKVSLDDGQTWSRSEKLITSPFFNVTSNVKNKPMELADGVLLVPAYHELLRKYSLLLRVMPDGPKVRYRVRKMTGGGKKAIQPVLLRGKGGLAAFFRNADKGRILGAWSGDMGRSWSGLTETRLPNPDSGFDMIEMEGGYFLGFINYSSEDRANLTMVVSGDGGGTWRRLISFEDSPGMEYSYPSVFRSPGGLYHLTYTYERKRIKHVVFNEAWIKRLMEGGI